MGRNKITAISFLLTFSVLFAYSSLLCAEEKNYVPGEVLVKFTAAATPTEISVFETAHGLTLLNEFAHLRVRHYRLKAGTTVEDAIRVLETDPIVVHANPNYYRRPQYFPSDPRFEEQWSLHNTGQVVNGLSGPADVDIDWPEAMDLFTGTEPVIVAVIDSGVAIDHPEILPNMWVNSDEIPDNLFDDDGNGYIDDYLGWDYFDNDNVPLDENGHGTMVASLIAGAMGNGEGGVGVAPHVKIMALRAFNDFGESGLMRVDNFIAATTYAASNGAKIINASFGGEFDHPDEDEQVQWLDGKGILLIAAAGNGGADRDGDDNDDSPIYPASYPHLNVISVAATDQEDELTGFSNYGATSVDLAAPGNNIFGADIRRSPHYFENFETGSAGWTQGHEPGSLSPYNWSLYDDLLGRTWLTDSNNNFGLPVDYSPYTNSWAMSPSIDLASTIGPQLIFYERHRITFFDYLYVEVSTDGIIWDLVDIILGFSSIGSMRPVDLSSYEGQVIQIRFRLWTDGIFQSDGAYIDYVMVTKVDVFQYDGKQYKHGPGTSFSAPLVSGVAALLMSQRPDLNHRQVRQLILDNVDPLTLLEGKVATGGRLNAHKALLAAKEPPGTDSEGMFYVIPNKDGGATVIYLE